MKFQLPVPGIVELTFAINIDGKRAERLELHGGVPDSSSTRSSRGRRGQAMLEGGCDPDIAAPVEGIEYPEDMTEDESAFVDINNQRNCIVETLAVQFKTKANEFNSLAKGELELANDEIGELQTQIDTLMRNYRRAADEEKYTIGDQILELNTQQQQRAITANEFLEEMENKVESLTEEFRNKVASANDDFQKSIKKYSKKIREGFPISEPTVDIDAVISEVSMPAPLEVPPKIQGVEGTPEDQDE